MKNIRLFIAVLILPLLFNGCMKEDIDELRRDLAKQAERIAALEKWAESVNTNISSLQALIDAMQTADYITNVTPLIEGGNQVGYTISFLNGSPINIYHGAKGDKGDTGANGTTPVIGVAQDPAYTDPDDPYYWTVDKLDGSGPQFLLASGNKIPVTGEKGEPGAPGDNGQNGSTPRVAIGTDNYWYVSPDGTATGTPPGGTGWQATGVKATGADGVKGDQGDAIFAADGLDNNDPDFVVLTLADGVTKISIPKYKSIGISFTAPEPFTAGQVRVITYTNVGGTPAAVVPMDIPAGWEVTVNRTSRQITIVAPQASEITNSNRTAQVAFLVSDGGKTLSMPVMQLSISSAKYKVGSIYRLANGTAGVVYWLDKIHLEYDPVSETGTCGMMVSVEGPYHEWGPSVSTNARDKNYGLENMNTVYSFAGNTFSGYPVFEWIDSRNPSGTTYSAGTTGVWYLPARNEVTPLWEAWNADRTDFNNALKAAGGKQLATTHYLTTSTETNASNTIAVRMDNNSEIPYNAKSNAMDVRAIFAFGKESTRYKIGDYYPEPDNASTAQGIVWWLDPDAIGYDDSNPAVPVGMHGKMVSLDETNARWATGTYASTLIGAGSTGDGMVNLCAVSSLDLNMWSNSFPAFSWVAEKNGGYLSYHHNPDGTWWYIPAFYECTALAQIWYSNQSEFDNKATAAGGTPLSDGYWSSTEWDNNLAVSYITGLEAHTAKDEQHKVRAIRTF